MSKATTHTQKTVWLIRKYLRRLKRLHLECTEICKQSMFYAIHTPFQASALSKTRKLQTIFIFTICLNAPKMHQLTHAQKISNKICTGAITKIRQSQNACSERAFANIGTLFIKTGFIFDSLHLQKRSCATAHRLPTTLRFFTTTFDYLHKINVNERPSGAIY